MNRTFLVVGEAALWLGSGYEPWKKTLAESVLAEHAHSPTGITLGFGVSSLLRNGHHFDLDNLVTPVFQALLGKRRSASRVSLAWWRASLAEQRPPALVLAFCDEPAAALTVPNGESVLDCRIPAPFPLDSREGGRDFVEAIRVGLSGHTPAPQDRFAIELAFGPDVGDITWVEERPLKPVVDCLFPVFGGTGGDPHDWKMTLIQVRRDDPKLNHECSVRAWRLGDRAGESPQPLRRYAAARTETPTRSGRSTPPRSPSMTNYDRLDEAAKQLGSPPAELPLDDIIRRAKALHPEMASSPRDGLSATMDYQAINIRGRASAQGDFEKSDRWNRSPAFLKVGRGVYRRLSEAERRVFRQLWDAGETLLRRESFDAAEWDRLISKHGA